MRIAFAVPEFPAISETFIRGQIDGVAGLGHTVDVVAVSPARDSASLDTTQHASRVHFTGAGATHGRHLLGAARWLLSDVARWSAMEPPPAPGATPKLLRRLRLVYHAGAMTRLPDYDIVHCHFGPRGADVARLRAAGAITGRLITSFHGYDVRAYPRACSENPYSYLFQAGDLFLANSEHTRRALLELGCPPDRLLCHSVGVDLSEIRYAARSISPGETLRILTIARLVPEKGVEFAIRAVAELMRRMPGMRVEYVIAGDGILRAPLQSLINELGVADGIQLAGWQHRGAVLRQLARAHIFLHSSIRADNGAEEGAGVVLMEAQAAGLPVVATRVGGIPEVVREGESAYLAEERDSGSLSDCLERLVRSQDEWARMGRLGREFVESRFDNARLSRGLLRIYRRVSAQCPVYVP